jgi:hypothetical protein
MNQAKSERRPEVRRFPMPKGSPAPSVTIREVFGADETEAARMIDALSDPTLGARGVIAAEKREAIRRSIVAIDNVPVDPDVPLFVIDHWGRAASRALERFFGEINGLKQVEIDAAIEAGEPLWDEAAARKGTRFRLPPRCSLEAVT